MHDLSDDQILMHNSIWHYENIGQSRCQYRQNLSTKDLLESNSQQHSPNLNMGLFSLLPEAQGEDYEEDLFAKRMKKKKDILGKGDNRLFIFFLHFTSL